jgi:hypothetical protein
VIEGLPVSPVEAGIDLPGLGDGRPAVGRLGGSGSVDRGDDE